MGSASAPRTREFGVRLAVGSSTRRLLLLVLRDAAAVAAAGVSAGAIAAIALTRVLDSALYRVRATDPLTFGAVAAALLIVAVAGAFAPARRAARVNPLTSLNCT